MIDHRLSRFAAQTFNPRWALIAGGAAVNFDLASDVDVFFCDRERWHTAVGRWLGENWVETYEEAYREQEFFAVTLPLHLLNCEGKPVQYIYRADIATGEWRNWSVDNLLNTFDISTHRVALYRDGQLTGPYYTETYEPPVILRYDHYPAVLYRYLKICQRYGHSPQEEELKKLGERGDFPGVFTPLITRQGEELWL